MEENIKSLINDCLTVIEKIKECDDPYHLGQLHTTQAIITRLELILMTITSKGDR